MRRRFAAYPLAIPIHQVIGQTLDVPDLRVWKTKTDYSLAIPKTGSVVLKCVPPLMRVHISIES